MVVCTVAWELFSGRKIRHWRNELLAMRQPPFAIGSDALFVAYYASAEIGCFLSLGWALPGNILDLFVEFRRLTNGLSPAGGNGLIGALQYHGLPSIDTMEKDAMRELAMRSGDYTPTEKNALLDYCESDVAALAKLLSRMMPEIDLPRALLRGRYMAAAAYIEHNGIPIDTDLLQRLKENWGGMQDILIKEVDKDYSVYDKRTFVMDYFAAYLNRHDIAWPLLASGKLDLQR